MPKFITQYHLERSENEIALSVKFTIGKVYPATWDSPAEGGEIEVLSVTHDGKEIELTPAEQDALCEWIATEDWDDFDPDHARDMRRDELLIHGDAA